ncbi:MAG: hypothetical protein GY898_32410 [Proteobacteria bacterium]|nr:hypothetical protein [Pseudomonadota bacterium]
MSAEPLLVEVIGGPKVVLELDVSGTVEGLAEAAAAAVERSLTDDDGKAKAWRLFAPNGKGGFTPARANASLEEVVGKMKALRDSGGKGGFAGPGTHEGTDYLFRIRLFVPSLPPPKPVTEKPPIDDEEAIDLTNIEAEDVGLETVRRIQQADPPPKKKRRRRPEDGGPRTGKHRTADGADRRTGRTRAVGASEPGRRRRKRTTGEIPEGAGKSGRIRRKARNTGDIPEGASRSQQLRKQGGSGRQRKRRRSGSMPAEVDAPAETLPEEGLKPLAEAAPPEPDETETTRDEPTAEPPAAEEAPAPPEKAPPPPEDELDEPNDVGESTAVMTKEALNLLKEATVSGEPRPPATLAPPPPPEPLVPEPPAEPEPPPPPPEPEKPEVARVVTTALAGKTPVRGTPAVTTQGAETIGGSRTGGRTGGMRRTGAMRRSGTMDGARRTGSGGKRSKKKKKNSGILGLLVALVLFAGVTVTFVVLLQDKGTDPTPTPEPPTEAAVHNLSDRLEIESWDHPTEVDLTEIQERFNGLVASGVPDDLERLSAIELVVTELVGSCDVEFLACAAGSRAAFAAYRGCRNIADCGDERTRGFFKQSIELSDRSLKAVTGLEPEYRTDALKRVTVQAVRLAGQSMKGVRGVAPDLAALAEQACTGSLRAVPDCVAAMKP